jgi:hypothetical protein
VGKGSILVKIEMKGHTRRIKIKDVLHVPKSYSNLLLVNKLFSKGLKVNINMIGYVVKMPNGKMVATTSQRS